MFEGEFIRVLGTVRAVEWPSRDNIEDQNEVLIDLMEGFLSKAAFSLTGTGALSVSGHGTDVLAEPGDIIVIELNDNGDFTAMSSTTKENFENHYRAVG